MHICESKKQHGKVARVILLKPFIRVIKRSGEENKIVKGVFFFGNEIDAEKYVFYAVKQLGIGQI
jgi:hypothetical protein